MVTLADDTNIQATTVQFPRSGNFRTTRITIDTGRGIIIVQN
jgi:hypothetical protein